MENNNKNATNTAPAPQQDEELKELMKMKAAYAQFEAESRKNRTFGEKVVESLPYVLSGIALAGSGIAVGVSIKALNTTSDYIKSQSYAPSPDGELE